MGKRVLKNYTFAYKWCQKLEDVLWNRLFACLPANIYFGCKAGPHILVIWKHSRKLLFSHTTDTQYVGRFLAPWMSPVSTLLWFFFKVIQNCFPLLSTQLSLPFSNQEIIIISIKLLCFLFLLVLTFVFLKIFLKYLLVKYQIQWNRIALMYHQAGNC